MAVTGIDPSAAQVMELASQVLTSQATIRRQRTVIWGLVTALRAERQASSALVDLLDELLGSDDG